MLWEHNSRNAQTGAVNRSCLSRPHPGIVTVGKQSRAVRAIPGKCVVPAPSGKRQLVQHKTPSSCQAQDPLRNECPACSSVVAALWTDGQTHGPALPQLHMCNASQLLGSTKGSRACHGLLAAGPLCPDPAGLTLEQEVVRCGVFQRRLGLLAVPLDIQGLLQETKSHMLGRKRERVLAGWPRFACPLGVQDPQARSGRDKHSGNACCALCFILLVKLDWLFPNGSFPHRDAPERAGETFEVQAPLSHGKGGCSG